MRASLRRPTLGGLALTLISAPLWMAGMAASSPAGPGTRVDPTIHVDAQGRHYVVDPRVDIPRRRTTPAVAPFPLDQTFLLHSKPGSQHTIFLDFDGTDVTGTLWNSNAGVASGFHQGWTLDGDGSTFNDTERTAIQSIWQRVSEDYAPFDVDVTTADPGDAAIDRSGSSDPTYGTRALITQSSQAWTALCNQLCGGIAYIDVFDAASGHAATQPAWIFANGLSNDTKAIAEAASHEVGHNFGLHHDGNVNGSPDYDQGHGAWAPIMGAAYDRPITQWSHGSYVGANNSTEDDVALIAANGAPLRPDETSVLPTGTAYITSSSDTDTYDLGTCSGSLTLTANPAPTSPNLDISLTLLGPGGSTVASNDPASAFVTADVASGMGASISTSVPAAAYQVRVDGVGNGDWVTGYDDYGSIGAYTLGVTGSCTPAATAPTAPTGLSGVANGPAGSVTLTWSAPASDGGSPVTGYDVLQGGVVRATTAAGVTSAVVGGLTRGTTYSFSVLARNAVGPGPVAVTSVTVPASAPGAPVIGRAASGAKGGKKTATATWQPPADDGGAAILHYQVVAYHLSSTGAVIGTVRSGQLSSTARSLKMTLAAGKWRFAVLARNAVGAGPLSARSNAVTSR